MKRFVVPFLAVFGVIVLIVAAIVVWKIRVPPKLWSENQIKLIDNFNDDTEANLIGGEPFTQAFAGGGVDASILQMDTPNKGKAAQAISYDLPTGSRIAWGTGLNELDISVAESVTFWLRARDAPLPAMQVELIDAWGVRAQSALPQLDAPGEWQRIIIPTSAFKDINFNRLGRFVLRVSASDSPLKGTLYLDDLAFVGPAHVTFLSLKDNLYAFSDETLIDAGPLLELPRDAMLRAIAGDTWGYFRDLVDKNHHLPVNYIQTRPTRLIGDYTSTTDIAMYMLAVVSGYDLDLINYASASKRIRNTLEQLEQLPKWKNLYYNYYSTTNLQVTNRYISSVDNAWLAASLVVVRQAFPELTGLANRLLKPMDLGVFFDPENEQMRLGFEIERGRFAPYHYGLLATEARIISVIAIGKGDVPKKHWFRIYRTLPDEWDWQGQSPQGEYATYYGFEVFQGYYVYSLDGEKVPVVPSWGGSLFEFLMPTLVVDETRLAPEGLGLNNRRAVKIHMDYALRERGYPVWGISPCATPKNRHGGYSEYGVTAIGSQGYKDEAIITPHVSLMALSIAPHAVNQNIREMIDRYDMYGPYGFYDSVDVKRKEVAYRYLALDQGMSLVAINNFLNDGAIQRRFEQDPIMDRVKELLRVEKFFEQADKR